MASLNRIVVLGKILSDPESKFTVDGRSVTKFGMPISNGFNQAPGSIEVVCFGKLAEVCGQTMKIGINVLVEGRIQIRSFNDQGGNRKWVSEIVASDVQLVDSARSVSDTQSQAVAAKQDSSAEEEVEELPEDDLPF